jgi:hypothetical protein
MAKRIPRCRLTGSGGDCETVFEDEVTIAWQNHRIIVVRLIGTTRRGIERLASMPASGRTPAGPLIKRGQPPVLIIRLAGRVTSFLNAPAWSVWYRASSSDRSSISASGASRPSRFEAWQRT